MKRTLLLSAITLPGLLSAQLTITDSLSTSALTTLLEGFNITISNLTVNCPESAYGEFDGTSEIPITHGLVLTSGTADAVAGTVYDFASGGCHDGLGRTSLNQNEGAESTLAFFQAALALDAAGLHASMLKR